MGIKFSRVDYKYDVFSDKVLNDVNLNINEKDEFVFILGHTGSGKTTIVQNMNVLLLPTSGQIEIFGKNVVTKVKHPLKLNTKKNKMRYALPSSNKLFVRGNTLVYYNHLKDLRKHVGLVFQFPEYQLFETTVLKDVMFGPKNFGLSDEEAKKSAIDALRLVGVSNKLYEKSPFNLSGGQMRRVAIAGILALNPDIIILDEPTVGLDPKGKEELIHLLKDIQKRTHKSIIVISHDMNVVAKCAKRVIVMNKGKIVFDGNTHKLFENIPFLKEYNLDLPDIALTALKLKEKGLIHFNSLPLTKEELLNIITSDGGDRNE